MPLELNSHLPPVVWWVCHVFSMFIPINLTEKPKSSTVHVTVSHQGIQMSDQNQSLLNLCIFQKQTLMQHVLRCDYEACRQYLVNLEQAFLLDQGSQDLGALLDHRCDGNRNILHAAVSVCFPVSNKETKEEEGKLVLWKIKSGCP